MTIPWYKSKQFWFNVLAVVVTVAAAYGFDHFQADPRALLISQLAIAVINVVLRFAFPASQASGPNGATKGVPLTLGAARHRPTGDAQARANRAAAAVFAAVTAGLSALLLM